MTRTSPWIRSTEQHLGLVQPIALHYAYRSGQDLDDLIQVGRLGLIMLLGVFDPATTDHLAPMQDLTSEAPSFIT